MPGDLHNIRTTLPSEKKALLARRNVIGVGIGYKNVSGKQTGDLSIICSVEQKLPRAKLTGDDLLPSFLNDIPIDVLETGQVIAFEDPKGKIRPAPGGVSIGHSGVTAGTLGMWVKKNGEFHILSNNHVIANSNNAKPGDAVLQPGAFDSGVEKIAELSEFVRIEFGGVDNLMDAAIAKAYAGENGGSGCSVANSVARLLNFGASGMGSKTRLKPVKIAGIEDIVRDEILNIGKVTGLAEAELDMEVKKMGRTTELTFGKIQQIDATIKVTYGNSQSAFFVDQVVAGDMSRGGDSGSVVVTKDDNRAVGLLFAGSDVLTVMNRIQNVFDALDISL